MDGAISASVTQADKSGAFRFGGVMEGPYVVTVTARGFQMATQPVSMVAGYHTVKITLKQSEGEEYTNGNVTAHRRLVAELATDRVDYEVGDSVYVRYRLTNPGPDAVTLTFPSGQEYDLVLEGSDGKVWQWADGKLFAEVTGQRVLAPGETFEFRAGVTLYSGWARPGSSYLLTGVLAVRPDAADGITQAETEGVVKFRVGSGEWPPGPPPGPIPGSTAGRGVKAYLDAAFAEDSVRVEYRVVNAGPDALRLMYRSGQQYDLVLDGPDGEVWRWSEGRGFTDALWEQEFAPGDSIVVQEAFSVAGMALPTQGTYVLTGFLAVRADEPDAVSATETEARLKFTVRSEDGKALRMDPVVTSGNDEAVGPVFVDFDNDGIVGFTDFLIFAGAFGTQAGTAGYQQVFDLDRNGAVEFRDFVLFVREYKK